MPILNNLLSRNPVVVRNFLNSTPTKETLNYCLRQLNLSSCTIDCSSGSVSLLAEDYRPQYFDWAFQLSEGPASRVEPFQVILDFLEKDFSRFTSWIQDYRGPLYVGPLAVPPHQWRDHQRMSEFLRSAASRFVSRAKVSRAAHETSLDRFSTQVTQALMALKCVETLDFVGPTWKALPPMSFIDSLFDFWRSDQLLTESHLMEFFGLEIQGNRRSLDQQVFYPVQRWQSNYLFCAKRFKSRDWKLPIYVPSTDQLDTLIRQTPIPNPYFEGFLELLYYHPRPCQVDLAWDFFESLMEYEFPRWLTPFPRKSFRFVCLTSEFLNSLSVYLRGSQKICLIGAQAWALFHWLSPMLDSDIRIGLDLNSYDPESFDSALLVFICAGEGDSKKLAHLFNVEEYLYLGWPEQLTLSSWEASRPPTFVGRNVESISRHMVGSGDTPGMLGFHACIHYRRVR